MNDIAKTNIVRRDNPKRTRRRNRNKFRIPLSSLPVLLVIILVLVFLGIFAVLFLFNIKTISVVGQSQYKEEDVKSSLGVEIGDSLVGLKAIDIKTSVMQNLMYVDEVRVKKEFPHTLIVEVEPSIPKVNVEYSGGYLLVSAGGKILDICAEAKPGLLVVYGYNPEFTATAEMLASQDDQKTKAFETILETMETENITKIKSVDMSDKYDVTFDFDGRITIEAGNVTDMEYKLRYADKVLNENIGDKKEGYFIFIGTNEASFVQKEDMELYRQNRVTAVSETTPPETSPAFSDVSGETELSGVISSETTSTPFTSSDMMITSDTVPSVNSVSETVYTSETVAYTQPVG